MMLQEIKSTGVKTTVRRKPQDRRKRSKYIHNMSRRGYVNIAEDMEKVLENVVKKKKGIATSLPSISFTSKNVVEEEEVIATRPSISKNESSAPEGCTYRSSAPEGCTYPSSAPEGCTYQSSAPEGCTYQSSAPEGRTYP
uniref:NBS-LRR type resistance protein n=1 Tax=Cucumis melo TaxID=3656 RepID=A0A9I9E3P3_CUCME